MRFSVPFTLAVITAAALAAPLRAELAGVTPRDADTVAVAARSAGPPFAWWPTWQHGQQHGMLHYDMRETSTGYDILADLPGFDRDHVKVEVEGHALHIEAERHDDGTERLVGGMHVVERSFGKVFRSIPLPPNADMDSLTGASYKNGVLHMNVHKKAGASLEGRRKIELLK